MVDKKGDHYITINVWRSDGTMYGHASLKTSSSSEHNYMSHWPKGNKKGPQVNDTSVFNKNISEDIRDEGRRPDFVVKLKASAEQLKKIERYVETRKNTHETWTGTDNCVDAVVKALKTGGIANYKLKFNRSKTDIVSTPIELIEKIKEDIKNRKVDYKLERDDNQHWNKDPKNIRKYSAKDAGQGNTTQVAAVQVADDVYNKIAKSESLRTAKVEKMRSADEISIG